MVSLRSFFFMKGGCLADEKPEIKKFLSVFLRLFRK